MAHLADRTSLIAELRRAGLFGRTEIVEEPHGFRLRPRGLNGEQTRTIRQGLARLCAGYANVIVGNGALLPAIASRETE